MNMKICIIMYFSLKYLTLQVIFKTVTALESTLSQHGQLGYLLNQCVFCLHIIVLLCLSNTEEQAGFNNVVFLALNGEFLHKRLASIQFGPDSYHTVAEMDTRPL